MREKRRASPISEGRKERKLDLVAVLPMLYSGWEAKSENQISLMTLGLNNKREVGIIYSPRAPGPLCEGDSLRHFMDY